MSAVDHSTAYFGQMSTLTWALGGRESIDYAFLEVNRVV